MQTVAIVPARGGSKGLPGKNIRNLAGKPLIAYSILAGLGAKHVDAVYVSTEDETTASVAKDYGANLIERPAELATDTAQNDLVMRHALETIHKQGGQPENVILLQPTSPLRQACHIDECFEKFQNENAASCWSICEVDHHPGKSVILEEGHIKPFTCDFDMEARRQDMVPVMRQNGAIYIVKVDDFMETGRLYRKPCAGYQMDRWESIDIDDALDLQFAEVVLQSRLDKAYD